MRASGAFRVGAVIRRTVDILGGDMPRFVGLAMLFSLLPQLSVLALTPMVLGTGLSGPRDASAAWPFVSGLAVFAIAVVGRGAVMAAALAACGGRPWTFRSAVGTGAASFPSILSILILDYLGTILASVLLLVPGLMLLCRWIVAVAAGVAERPGPLAALRRSRDLTAGHRWPIFGLLLVFALLSLLVPVAALLASVGQITRMGVTPFTLVNALSTAVFGMVGNVGTVVLYDELRAAKGEGLATGLATAFE